MANPVLTRIQTAEGAVRRYHVMVKPIGSLCNLDCTYCYYLHKEQLLGRTEIPKKDRQVSIQDM